VAVTLTPERRSELLAIADRDEVIDLAERCAQRSPAPVVTKAPEVGTIVLEVREPIANDRFHLGEVLACRAEVAIGDAVGWSIRLGDDRLATLAAAVCDATVEAGGQLAGEVLDLCERTAVFQASEQAAEWAELEPTIVAFEEL
jgi:alpha-D-ribose 1-methylphosphonate 5-triphosphate synthase subunit PhnG